MRKTSGRSQTSPQQKSMLRESEETSVKMSKKENITKGFILSPTEVQYKATTFWHIKHHILKECCSHETSKGFSRQTGSKNNIKALLMSTESSKSSL